MVKLEKSQEEKKEMKRRRRRKIIEIGPNYMYLEGDTDTDTLVALEIRERDIKPRLLIDKTM